ncbi:MAG: hypothetical protein SP4CHLAM5_12090 [Chlamydiia bacterium]|nr:hypothetical protein [Chlamydiia bacterium]MCH9619063.1 hypothetical protein [Chlamydiia bacterium]
MASITINAPVSTVAGPVESSTVRHKILLSDQSEQDAISERVDIIKDVASKAISLLAKGANHKVEKRYNRYTKASIQKRILRHIEFNGRRATIREKPLINNHAKQKALKLILRIAVSTHANIKVAAGRYIPSGKNFSEDLCDQMNVIVTHFDNFLKEVEKNTIPERTFTAQMVRVSQEAIKAIELLIRFAGKSEEL